MIEDDQGFIVVCFLRRHDDPGILHEVVVCFLSGFGFALSAGMGNNFDRSRAWRIVGWKKPRGRRSHHVSAHGVQGLLFGTYADVRLDV